MFEGLALKRGELAPQDLLALDIQRYSHEATRSTHCCSICRRS
jgi:hypothetical protein